MVDIEAWCYTLLFWWIVWKAGPLCTFWMVWKARINIVFRDEVLYIQKLKFLGGHEELG